MLHSTYNLNHLGSTSAIDMLGQHSGVGGGGGMVGMTGMYDSCGIGGMRTVSPPPPSTLLTHHHPYSPPLPQRRYSIGGLPSASLTECLHIMQQNAEAAQLSSLLNETKTSITRASQILSRGEDISDDILLSAAAGDLAAQYSRLSGNNVDITAANILNQLPPSNSFSSHPNIYYSQPNYHNQMSLTGHDYLSRIKRPANYQYYSNTATRPFCNSGATSLPPQHTTYAVQPSTSSYFYHQPMAATALTTGPATAAYDTYHSKYYAAPPPPPYTSLPSSSYHTPHHHYRPPMHYTSNPAISQSSNYYFKHNYNNLMNTAATTTTAPISFNNYPNNLTGYSNQHFDLHHTYNNCNTKLDLDYTKPSEHAKRQVSFNVDVDTLSIES